MTAQPNLDGTAEADIDHAIHTRDGFLSQPTVATFIEWLIAKLNTVTFSLNILPSRYVPHGLQGEITGISAIIPDHYRWKSAWTDRRGIRIESECWHTTRHAMAELRTWLKESLDQDNSEELKQACYAVLEWGGVNRAREFIDKLHMEGRLVDYLRSVKHAIDLNQADVHSINPDLIESYDSGLTKIHALLSDDGLPIYDSRVAASMAAFRYLFYKETQQASPYLEFPVGASRGNQVRNLFHLEDNLGDPRLYSVARYRWARAQVRLGWMMQAVLARSDLFLAEGNMIDRMHAFEAALFMVGYDLRAIPGLDVDAQYNKNPDRHFSAATQVNKNFIIDSSKTGDRKMPIITIPFPVSGTPVDLGKFIGCWIAWANFFKPADDWRTINIPCRARNANLNVLLKDELVTVPRSQGYRVFGCDTILRSISNTVNVDHNIRQASQGFINAGANGFYMNFHKKNIQGVNSMNLTAASLDYWDTLTRTERLTFIEFGKERLEFIIGILKANGILVDRIDIHWP